MNGTALVKHAINLVLRNFGAAVRASFGPIVIAALVMIVVNMALGFGTTLVPYGAIFNPLQTNIEPSAQVVGTAMVSIVVNLFVFFFVLSWIAVTWHRYVLLEENPPVLPRLDGKPIVAYIGRAIILFIVVLMIGLPLMTLFAMAFGPALVNGSIVSALVFNLLLTMLLSYVWMRFALVLPAVSVDEKMTIGESWASSGQYSSAIWIVVLLLALVNFVLNLPSQLIYPAWPEGGFVLSIAASWFSLMLGFSILTTLYGHIVEGRPLPQ